MVLNSQPDFWLKSISPEEEKTGEAAIRLRRQLRSRHKPAARPYLYELASRCCKDLSGAYWVGSQISKRMSGLNWSPEKR